MATTWPAQLQQKLNVAGFQKIYGDTRVYSEVDVGRPKIRSRYTVAVDEYSCQILLDFDEVSIWETFYKTQLGNGTLTFDYNDPFTQQPTEFQFSPTETPTLVPLGGRVFSLTMRWQKVP